MSRIETLRDLIAQLANACAQEADALDVEIQRRLQRLDALAGDWTRRIGPSEIRDALDGDF